jgi:hypothetical protein
MTLEQTAARLGVKPVTIYRFVRRGLLHPVVVTRKRRGRRSKRMTFKMAEVNALKSYAPFSRGPHGGTAKAMKGLDTGTVKVLKTDLVKVLKADLAKYEQVKAKLTNEIDSPLMSDLAFAVARLGERLDQIERLGERLDQIERLVMPWKFA